MEPTQIDARLTDLALAGVSDVIWFRVDSPVGTPDHSAVFMEVVVDQYISHLVCSQEAYLKDSVNWELVRGDTKGFN